MFLQDDESSGRDSNGVAVEEECPAVLAGASALSRVVEGLEADTALSLQQVARRVPGKNKDFFRLWCNFPTRRVPNGAGTYDPSWQKMEDGPWVSAAHSALASQRARSAHPLWPSSSTRPTLLKDFIDLTYP